MPAPEEITDLLQSWSHGDRAAIEKLVPLVYDELHRLAQRYMSDERPDHTLQTTALVNEAFFRRPEREGSCRGIDGFTRNGAARLEIGKELAAV